MIVVVTPSTGRPRAIAVKQTFRQQAEVWYGPLWLAKQVARQAVLDGAKQAAVTAGFTAGESRVLGVDIPAEVLVTYTEARGLLGRRTWKEVRA